MGRTSSVVGVWLVGRASSAVGLRKVERASSAVGVRQVGRSRNSVVFVAIAMRINQVFCGLRRPFFVELALEMATRNSAPGSATDFFPLRGHFGLRVISKAQGSAELKAAAFYAGGYIGMEQDRIEMNIQIE